MLIIVGVYLVNPTPTNPMHEFIFPAYPLAEKNQNGEMMYGKGLRDVKFLTFYVIFFTFTREFTMQRILYPLSQKWLPKSTRRNKGTVWRFMEQSYTALYFAFFGPFGLYVMKNTTGLWYFESAPFWDTHPNLVHTAMFKSYYLLQWSYWLQQAIVLVLLLEKPRKDFKELVLHHVVTLALITLSWRFHFTYCGLAVFITHDVSDFFLAVSFLLILRARRRILNQSYTCRPPKFSTTLIHQSPGHTSDSSSAHGYIFVTTTTSGFFGP